MTVEISNLREDIINESFINEILREKYGDDIMFLSYSARIGSEKGVNYVGDLIAVDIQVKDVKSQEEKMMYWMCKATKRGKCEESFKEFTLFDREIAFYTTFIEDLDKYVKPNILRIVPLIYSTNKPDLQILVFEHLGANGYREPKDKRFGLNDDHVLNVCKWLAELHGSAYILFQKYPGGYSEWKKNNFFSETIQSDKFDKYTDAMLNGFYNLLDDLRNGSENDSIIESFETSLKDFFENRPEDISIPVKMKRALYDSRSEFKTLCHGDPWFNNMLFKYDNNNRSVQDVILLDMQVIYSGNIGSDLACFLLSSVTHDALTQNLDKYLEYYRICISTFVSDLDPSIQVTLTLEDIKRDFIKSSLLGFIFASRAFPHSLIDQKDASSIDLKQFDLTNMEDVKKLMEETRAHGKKVLHCDTNLYSRMLGVIRFLTESKIFDSLRN